ncbi:MAG: AAA family ATPase [Candidatus Helarchaeota archaeon]
MTLIIFTGIPSVGKTSIAKELISLAREREISITRVDSDELREQFYREGFNPELEAKIKEKTLESVKQLLQKDCHVISDDLNYYRSMRHDLITLATKQGTNYFIIHVTAPLERALEWNEKRGLPIPQDVIRKVHERFDRFEKYRWDTPLLVIESDKMTTSEAAIFLLQVLYQRFFEKPPPKKEPSLHLPNVVEQLDLFLRSQISSFLSTHPDKKLAKTVNKLRKMVLKKTKKEKLTIDEGKLEFQRLLEQFGIQMD